MTLIHAIVYLAALGLGLFGLGRLLPKRLFKAQRFPYRAYGFEKEGRIYQKLKISYWQAKLPDMSRILPGLMPLKRIAHRPTDSELLRMVQETCVAEFIHILLSLLGLGVLPICRGWVGIIVYILYFLLGNLPFILIQRYNRPRLMHMLESSRRRAEQIRLKRGADDRRILILSASTGEGHNSCAAAVKEAFDARGLRCELEDGLRFISKPMSALLSQGHVFIYRYLPGLFRIGYRYSEKHPGLFGKKSPVHRMLACGAEPLHSFILEGGYDCVICTHIFAATMLTETLRRHPLNIRTGFIATDYTGYPGLEQTKLDLYFIPDASLAAEFAVGSITPESIVPSGIPVRQAVCRRTEPAFARRSLGLPVEGRYLLVMCGSMGCGPIRRLLALLSQNLKGDQHICVACGTNRRLAAALEQQYGKDGRIHIFGFIDEISLLMDCADLFLTKPGGLSSTEAAVKSLPMVMINAVAGCEEYNKNFFLRAGLGVTAETVDGLAALCMDVLSDGDCLARMSEAGRRFSRINAAETVCRAMLGEEIAVSPEENPVCAQK